MDICNKSLKELWAQKNDNEVICIDLYGNVFVMCGIAPSGKEPAFGYMHETSAKNPGNPATFEAENNIWKKHKPKTKFFGAIVWNEIGSFIQKPLMYYKSKDEAKKNLMPDEKIIGWEVVSHQI